MQHPLEEWRGLRGITWVPLKIQMRTSNWRDLSDTKKSLNPKPLKPKGWNLRHQTVFTESRFPWLSQDGISSIVEVYYIFSQICTSFKWAQHSQRESRISRWWQDRLICHRQTTFVFRYHKKLSIQKWHRQLPKALSRVHDPITQCCCKCEA